MVNYLIRKYRNKIRDYHYTGLLTFQTNLKNNPLYQNINRRDYNDYEKIIIDMVAYGLGQDPNQIPHKIKAEFQIIG